MKIVFNPIEGKFNIVPDSGTYTQHINPFTGEFNLAVGNGPFTQKFNPIEGEFNLWAEGGGLIYGNRYIDIYSDKAKLISKLILFGRATQSADIMPEGYTMLEYIASSGTQYINTEFSLNATDKVWTKSMHTSFNDGDNFIWCARSTDASEGAGWVDVRRTSSSAQSFYVRFAGTSSANASGYSLSNVIIETETSAGLFKLDGVETLNPVSIGSITSAPLEIFVGRNSSGSELGKSTMRLYGFRVTGTGGVRMNLIPCKNANDEVGMFDTISGKFFGNSGTGTFTAGPTISYTRLPYLKTTTKASYINTGIMPKTNTGFELSFSFDEISGTQGIFGLLNNSTVTNNFYLMKTSAGKIGFASGTGLQTTTYEPTQGDHLIKLNGDTLTIDDEDITVTRGELEATDVMYLGVRKNSESTGLDGKIYYFKIYEGNVLVMDLIPVKRGDGVLGFFDKIGFRFYPHAGNASYNFTTSSYTPITCNNGTITCRKLLPTGYTLLSSIATNNGPYIFTGIYLQSGDIVEADFKNSAAGSSGYGALYGGYVSGEATAFYANGDYYTYDSTLSKVPSGINVDTEWHHSIHNFGVNSLQIDNTTVTYDTFEFTATSELTLFARMYNNAYGYFWRGECKSFKVIRSGAVILDLVPAQRDSDSAVGMYDMVSDTFLETTNGTATAGDVAGQYEMDIVGTTEKVENTTNVFDKNNRTRINGYISETGANWTYVASGYSNRIPCAPNTTYTARYNGTGTQAVLSLASTSSDNIPSPTTTSVAVTSSVRKNNPTNADIVTVTTGPNDKWLIVAYNAADPQNTDMANNLQISTPSATAEPLLSLGDIRDEQDVISGTVTRRVGAIALNGAEEIYYISSNIIRVLLPGGLPQDSLDGACSHYKFLKGSSTPAADKTFSIYYATYGGVRRCVFGLRDNSINSANDFKTLAANQCAAGTPIVILYPLAEEVIEHVAPQPMVINQGNNHIEITEASLDNLELAVEL